LVVGSIPATRAKNVMRKIREYFQESWLELTQKVSWPTWSELQESTIVVMVASLIIAVVIMAMDFVFNLGMGSFYKMFV
jgi:preprotein translocase subunit SecE